MMIYIYMTKSPLMNSLINEYSACKSLYKTLTQHIIVLYCVIVQCQKYNYLFTKILKISFYLPPCGRTTVRTSSYVCVTVLAKRPGPRCVVGRRAGVRDTAPRDACKYCVYYLGRVSTLSYAPLAVYCVLGARLARYHTAHTRCHPPRLVCTHATLVKCYLSTHLHIMAKQ